MEGGREERRGKERDRGTWVWGEFGFTEKGGSYSKERGRRPERHIKKERGRKQDREVQRVDQARAERGREEKMKGRRREGGGGGRESLERLGHRGERGSSGVRLRRVLFPAASVSID